MARVTTPTVSIVLGTFNSEKFIGLQIQSILNQTFTNFELIISDDASSDTTPVILKKFARRDSRIRLTLRKKNVGMSENYTQMVERASGAFVAFSDHDDIWMQHKLELQLKYLLVNPQVGLCYHDSFIIDHNSEVTHASLQSFLNPNIKLYEPHNRDTLSKLIDKNHILGNTILCRSQFAKSCPPFPENFGPDYWIVLNAGCFTPVGFIDQRLIYYRRHQHNSWRLFNPTGIQKILLARDMYFVENFVQNLINVRQIITLLLIKKPEEDKKKLLLVKSTSLELIVKIFAQDSYLTTFKALLSSLVDCVIHPKWAHVQYALFIYLHTLLRLHKK